MVGVRPFGTRGMDRNINGMRKMVKTPPRLNIRFNWKRALGALIALMLAAGLGVEWTQALPRAEPEQVGMSSERLKRLDKVMQRYVDNQRLAGAATLIARRGKIAHLGVYGMANRETEQPMSADTLFRIASMTKPITSAAVMMLYEEGKFRLDQPVEQILPEFAEARVVKRKAEGEEGEAFEEPARKMTVRHLLTHTSGLTYGGGPAAAHYRGKRINPGFRLADITLAEMSEELGKVPLAFHPGDRWQYGYSTDVLGRLVEVASGMTLAQFFEERIFKPLQMNDTAFYYPKEAEERFAVVYSPDAQEGLKPHPKRAQGGWRTVVYPYEGPQTTYCGGSGLSSTIVDYARFCQMILNGGELDGVRLLSPTTVEMMSRDNLKAGVEFRSGQRFGLGFMTHTNPTASRSITSAGTIRWSGIWHTSFFIDPQQELIGIIMTQLYPTWWLDDQQKFEMMTYQAIVD